MKLVFLKYAPYILDLSFSKYGFQKMESTLQVIRFLKLIQTISILYLYRMGLSESALTPFSCFYHTVKYHVIHHVVLKYVEKITIACLISIHTKTIKISGSDEEHIEKQSVAGNNIYFSILIFIMDFRPRG